MHKITPDCSSHLSARVRPASSPMKETKVCCKRSTGTIFNISRTAIIAPPSELLAPFKKRTAVIPEDPCVVPANITVGSHFRHLDPLASCLDTEPTVRFSLKIRFPKLVSDESMMPTPANGALMINASNTANSAGRNSAVSP